MWRPGLLSELARARARRPAYAGKAEIDRRKNAFLLFRRCCPGTPDFITGFEAPNTFAKALG